MSGGSVIAACMCSCAGKRIYRLYREERLMVRKRSGRKRALGTPAPMVLPMAADMRWSLALVSDQVTGGRRFRILCLSAGIDRSFGLPNGSGNWRVDRTPLDRSDWKPNLRARGRLRRRR
jgi:hypothetical protein